MKELSRKQESNGAHLILGIADQPSEVEALQKLRFQVYSADLGAHFPHAQDEIDCDRYDEICQHLMVVDADADKVVGTYRVMLPEQSHVYGYYSESEFDITPLLPMRHLILEAGRSCTHPDYRGGSTILLLWTGLAHFIRAVQGRYVLGCASCSLADGGLQARRVWQEVKAQAVADNLMRPLHPYPAERLADAVDESVKMPPLIKGYLSLGGRICGYPAWDKDFNAADFPILIDSHLMDMRYRKHFGLV